MDDPAPGNVLKAAPEVVPVHERPPASGPAADGDPGGSAPRPGPEPGDRRGGVKTRRKRSPGHRCDRFYQSQRSRVTQNLTIPNFSVSF